MPKVAITGASGKTGRAMVTELLTHGYDVVTIKSNNGTFNTAGNGAEQLDETTLQLLNAVRGDQVQSFLLAHSDLITQS